jgi:hypothetical protein
MDMRILPEKKNMELNTIVSHMIIERFTAKFM